MTDFKIVDTIFSQNNNNTTTIPIFANKTYMAYAQLGSLRTYISYKFDYLGINLSIGYGDTVENALIPNNVIPNIYKSPNLNIWQSDFVSGSNQLISSQRINFSINSDGTIIQSCQGNNLMSSIEQFSVSNATNNILNTLQQFESYFPSDYYNYIYTRLITNPDEIIDIFKPESFLQNPCTYYDIEIYLPENLTLQKAWTDVLIDNILMPKFWTIINKYQAQYIYRNTYFLSFNQFLPNIFFQQNNYPKFLCNNGDQVDPNEYLKQFFVLTKPVTSIFSYNSPELFTMQTIMQGYFHLEYIKNSNNNFFTPFKEQDIFSFPLIGLLTLISKVLILENQLGIDSTKFINNDQSVYQFNYCINNNAVNLATNIFNYFPNIDQNLNLLSWNNYNNYYNNALNYSKEIDNNTSFKFSNGTGVGTYFFAIFLIHYNNILAMKQLLISDVIPSTSVLYPYTNYFGTSYFIKSVGVQILSPIENAYQILLPIQNDLLLITSYCALQAHVLNLTNSYLES